MHVHLGSLAVGGAALLIVEAMAVKTSACHFAALPVAVNLECHSHRHREAEL